MGVSPVLQVRWPEVRWPEIRWPGRYVQTPPVGGAGYPLRAGSPVGASPEVTTLYTKVRGIIEGTGTHK